MDDEENRSQDPIDDEEDGMEPLLEFCQDDGETFFVNSDEPSEDVLIELGNNEDQVIVYDQESGDCQKLVYYSNSATDDDLSHVFVDDAGVAYIVGGQIENEAGGEEEDSNIDSYVVVEEEISPVNARRSERSILKDSTKSPSVSHTKYSPQDKSRTYYVNNHESAPHSRRNQFDQLKSNGYSDNEEIFQEQTFQPTKDPLESPKSSYGQCGKCNQMVRMDGFAAHFREAHLKITKPASGQINKIVNQPNRDHGLTKCNKCQRLIKSSDFANHYREVHRAPTKYSSKTSESFKECSICKKELSRKDYLVHFKEAHTGVRLGCPKCPQTFRTTELLSVHYRNAHTKIPNLEMPKIFPAKRNSNQFLSQGALGRLGQVPSAPEMHLKSQAGPIPGIGKDPLTLVSKGSFQSDSISCSVCNKSYKTQREFTNHRRRKDFCRPQEIQEASPPRRRIGIIRRII